MIILIDERALATWSPTGASQRGDGITKKDSAADVPGGGGREVVVVVAVLAPGDARDADEMARFRVAHAMKTKRASHAQRIRFRLRMSRKSSDTLKIRTPSCQL
ncbi:MAG: hypothetical protein ACREJX_11630 [Polyangiaceae bacterium]